MKFHIPWEERIHLEGTVSRFVHGPFYFTLSCPTGRKFPHSTKLIILIYILRRTWLLRFKALLCDWGWGEAFKLTSKLWLTSGSIRTTRSQVYQWDRRKHKTWKGRANPTSGGKHSGQTRFYGGCRPWHRGGVHLFANLSWRQARKKDILRDSG